MAILAVVPREEGSAEGDGGVDILKARGEAGMVFQGLELRLGEGVVVADPGAAERAGDVETGKELCGALAGHGCAAVGVQGKHLGWMPCLTHVCSMRRLANAALSRSATIHPTT